MTTDNKLKEILLNLEYTARLPVGMGVCLQRPSTTIEEARSAILDLFKSLVPEESRSTCVCDRDKCFDDCREELLAKIEELRNESV